MADRQAGRQSRPTGDRDQVDIGHRVPGAAQRLGDRPRQSSGVALGRDVRDDTAERLVGLRNKNCTGLTQTVGQIQASDRDSQLKKLGHATQFGPTL